MSDKINFQQIAPILQMTQVVINNQKIEQKLKGEHFNIFSILNLETKENGTHSAFLGELLNPHGSHLMGDQFLKLFLDVIEENTLNRDAIQVTLEKNIGPVLINAQAPLTSSGGRIDIYLDDHKGNTVSIENKINAPEQQLQVVRYYNHRKGRNQVYYLTLDGEKPTPFSTSTLEADKDFKEITYAHHILDWLVQCQKEAFESPTLRESIKQYIHLIKKLTGQMNDRHQEELCRIILSNFEAVDSIVANADAARKMLCAQMQDLAFNAIKEAFEELDEIIVEKGNHVWEKHSQIWIRRKDQKDSRLLHFVLEPFSGDGHFGGAFHIGILNPPPHDSIFALPPNKTSLSKWIINLQMIPNIEGYAMNLSDKEIIQKLYTDKKFREQWVQHLVQATRAYFDEQSPALYRFLKTGRWPEASE